MAHAGGVLIHGPSHLVCLCACMLHTMSHTSCIAGTRCENVKLGVGADVTHTTGNSYEDTMTSHCRRGYHRVTGSHVRTCGGGGAWSGTALVCAGAGRHYLFQ